MNPIIMRLTALTFAGVAVAGCTGGGSSEDPREPGEACTLANYNQEKWRDSVLWRCTRQWDGSKYNYYWTSIRRAPSSVQTPLPDNHIAILEGSAVVIRNGAGGLRWNYTIGGGDTPPTMPLHVSSTGVITMDPSLFVTPQQVQCFGEEGVDCLGLTLRGTGPERPVTIDPATGRIEADLGIVVNVAPVQGFAGMDTECKIGPVIGRLTGRDYNQATGTATLEATGLPLDTTSSCGDQNDLFNDALGLPGTVDVRFLTKVKVS